MRTSQNIPLCRVGRVHRSFSLVVAHLFTPQVNFCDDVGDHEEADVAEPRRPDGGVRHGKKDAQGYLDYGED